jgi:hypothetical protein
LLADGHGEVFIVETSRFAPTNIFGFPLPAAWNQRIDAYKVAMRDWWNPRRAISERTWLYPDAYNLIDSTIGSDLRDGVHYSDQGNLKLCRAYAYWFWELELDPDDCVLP